MRLTQAGHVDRRARVRGESSHRSTYSHIHSRASARIPHVLPSREMFRTHACISHVSRTRLDTWIDEHGDEENVTQVFRTLREILRHETLQPESVHSVLERAPLDKWLLRYERIALRHSSTRPAFWSVRALLAGILRPASDVCAKFYAHAGVPSAPFREILRHETLQPESVHTVLARSSRQMPAQV